MKEPIPLARRILLFLALVTGMLAPLSPAAGAAEIDDGAAFVELINGLRSENGLPSLRVHPELVAPSREWAAHLAEEDALVHAPDLTTGITVHWLKIGENIGTSAPGKVNELFAAFVESPSHLENLLNPEFEYVGVGVFYDRDGQIWTTHRFMSVSASVRAAEPPMDKSAVSHLLADLIGSGI